MQTIFAQLKTQTCLLGGWAVYYLVNENFQKTTARSYIGSRDIDLVFQGKHVKIHVQHINI